MSYTWKPNRDSGSVRSHRNPNTRRRYFNGNEGCGESCTHCHLALRPENQRAATKVAAMRRQTQAWELI